ncbi:plasmid mobilization protein [Vibrio cholerae]|uniref:plasmid mobilization protein n=1 Tax=Vibrio cholerae TaxID=666 RepID=UPI0028DAC745|nr:mobilization protein [Vibrio cholerae]ELJ8688063.1 mobilization protein [Vibrio cholerae]HDZ9324839.1 mobilization protein [Vibrio cholerae]
MPNDTRNERIIFRVTEKEKQAFLKKVADAHTTASDLLRERVLKDEYFIIARAPKANLDKQRLLYLYNKTSNNMNQLAYQANLHHKSGTLTEKQFQRIIADLISIRNLLKIGIEHVD